VIRQHELAGVLTGLLLLDPPTADDGGPPSGELGVDCGSDRLRRHCIDGFDDTGVNPVMRGLVALGGIVDRVGDDQCGGDQCSDTAGEWWGFAGLVQASPQGRPVRVDDGRGPVGLLGPAQHLQQQPRRRGQRRGDGDGPHGEGLQQLLGAQPGVAVLPAPLIPGNTTALRLEAAANTVLAAAITSARPTKWLILSLE
jgi:hypothetical protein